MGIQCHVQMKDVIPVMHNITIDREYYGTGGGDNQDEPWFYLTCRVLLPNGALIYGNMADDCSSFWFDANHWGGSRWQIRELAQAGVPTVES